MYNAIHKPVAYIIIFREYTVKYNEKCSKFVNRLPGLAVSSKPNTWTDQQISNNRPLVKDEKTANTCSFKINIKLYHSVFRSMSIQLSDDVSMERVHAVTILIRLKHTYLQLRKAPILAATVRFCNWFC